jgi:PhnB protein
MSDQFPENTASPTSPGSSTVTINVYSKNVDKLWERAVGAGAKIVMPIANQFWGERYGKILDPFGHSWSLSIQVRMSRTERGVRVWSKTDPSVSFSVDARDELLNRFPTFIFSLNAE